MDPLLVTTDGPAGTPGNQFPPAPPATASLHSPGQPGRPATHPAPGQPGGTITVALTPVASGGIHVAGVDEWKGKQWDVPTGQGIRFSARGGDGGAGGRGEDGGRGGRGGSGTDSGREVEATGGGQGGHGGDAGAGTSGGAGGAGGLIVVDVAEADTNLLLAVDWDVSAGAGGAVGAHGIPGEGGEGGEGGKGFTWQVNDGVGYACCGGGRVCTCRKYNQVNLFRSYSRPAGPPGPAGFPGNPAPQILIPGPNGALGTVQIRIRSANGMESVYPGKYHLSVATFDLVDENGDGIMEPGEHIIVRNICVHNSGTMPSPAHSKIPIHINPTSWLDPPPDDPVYLPTSIFPGETVSVRGELRAFIRQEGVPRYPGVTFSAKDEMLLVAVMPGVEMVLPGFAGPMEMCIRYPLELEPPVTLRAVERGREVTFSWRLWNVSSKPYGLKSQLRRAAGTCLAEHGTQNLALRSGGLDMPDVIPAGVATTISQTFHVSALANQYTTSTLTLTLLLSEPTATSPEQYSTLPATHPPLRTVMTYPVAVQIAPVYTYDPRAQYLLIVNADTQSRVIQQIYALMNDLKTAVDVWNLSVHAGFINPATGRSVLLDYTGRAVVVFANPFDWFGRGVRSVFGLLDPWLVAHMAVAGTAFLFAGCTSGDEAMSPWFEACIFPTYFQDPQPAPIDRKILFPTLNCSQFNGVLNTQTVAPKSQMLKSSSGILKDETKKLERQLAEHFPLHRFSVAPTMSKEKKSKLAGTITIRQGLPREARVVADWGGWEPGVDRLPERNIYLLIAMLPWRTRVGMFWGAVGAHVSEPPREGTDAGAVVQQPLMPVLGPLPAPQDSLALEPGSRPAINLQIHNYVALSLAYHFTQLIQYFCHMSPWPDVIQDHNTLFQLPCVQVLLSPLPASPRLRLPLNHDGFVKTLGTLVAALQPAGAGQFIGQKMIRLGNRRANLRVLVMERLDAALAAVFEEKVAAKLKRRVLRAADGVREEARQAEVVAVVAGRVCGVVGAGQGGEVPWWDAAGMKGVGAWEEGEERRWAAGYAQVMGRVGVDMEAARAVVGGMVR